MYFSNLFLVLSLMLTTAGCSSLPRWAGKYKRLDGMFELYSEVDVDLLEVTIVSAGGSPKDQASVVTGFLAKIEGDRAKEMQLCRNGLCAKDCLSVIRRSTRGLIYESCDGDAMDGVYR